MNLDQDQKHVLYAMVFAVVVIFIGVVATWTDDDIDAIRQDVDVADVEQLVDDPQDAAEATTVETISETTATVIDSVSDVAEDAEDRIEELVDVVGEKSAAIAESLGLTDESDDGDAADPQPEDGDAADPESDLTHIEQVTIQGLTNEVADEFANEFTEEAAAEPADLLEADVEIQDVSPALSETELQQTVAAQETDGNEKTGVDADSESAGGAREPVIMSSGAVVPGAISELIDSYPNKLLLVHFWRSDCESCSASFEWLSDMARQYEDDGLKVIGVNEDHGLQDAANFLAHTAHVFENIADEDHALATAFWLQGLPSTFLLTPTGSRLHQETGFDPSRRGQYEDAIRNGLDQLRP